MNEKELQQLLSRFLEAETSELEEQRLSQLFDRPMLLEQRLARQIDRWNQIEKKTERRARAVMFRWIGGVAASLLLLFGIVFMTRQQQETRAWAYYEDTYDNPEDAAAETERALVKFSTALNKGLGNINETEEENPSAQ
ncbi:MAG: hypothetical protein IJM81_05275 [Prevotella sp.]|nr:hypothetical protein [Prevotella sp.]